MQKILAQAGVASRRAAEKIILAGRVRVNGRVVNRVGEKADPERDAIEVDGRPVVLKAKSYYLFYKPAGFLTTLSDPKGRPTVAEFLSKIPERVFPVGRLDMDAEGLLILTSDGELAARLMHPRHHVPKQYRVKVQGRVSDRIVAELAGGELIVDERPVNPAGVEVVKRGRNRTWLSMTLTEGRKRQIKRMCAQVGHPVLRLKRVGFGPLVLGRLQPGQIRPLREAEVRKLRRAAGLDPD